METLINTKVPEFKVQAYHNGDFKEVSHNDLNGNKYPDGIQIYPIGIGSDGGAPIPDGDGGFLKDRAGKMVLTKLDEGTLQEIAKITDGYYVRSTTGDLDLDVIYSQHIRKDLTSVSQGSSREKVWFERFWIFAAAAMFLLVFDYHWQYGRLSPLKQ